ncbi:uncharacterized protein LOC115255532 [Aedes albopictus]|uniref:Ionotropic glutamate receptor C-terminal domain-containing protein n=1 Tax=Aedes albopictus TaxID=7160 RepID=A0ABM1YKN3_AEDAL
MTDLKTGLRLLLLSLTIGSSVGQTEPPNDAETMLLDFVPFFKIPLKIAIFVCWPNEKSAELVRRMMMTTTQSPHLMQLHNDSLENVALLDTLEPHQHLAVIDVACPNSERFLTQAGYRIYHRIRWVLLDSEAVGFDGRERRESKVLNLLGGMEVTGNCEVFYFTWSDGGDLLVKDVYRISMPSGLISNVVAIWRNGTFNDQRMGLSTAVRRRNLQQTAIRTTVVYTDNYTLHHFEDYENPQIGTPCRTSYHLARILYHFYLNATMEKRFTSSWCYPNALGLCGDFIDNRTEATATVLLIVAWRLNYVAYLKTPIFAHVRFIYKMPNLSMTDNIFELPFNTNVWACTFALVVLSGGLFAGARAVGKRKYREHLELIDSAFNVIPIAAQQGSIIEAKGIGLRTFILVTLIGLMALEVSFSAKIISLIQAPSRRINTLKDLLESKLEVAADDTVYNRHFLSTATEPVRRELYEKKLLLKNGSMNVYGMEDGIARVREGLFAYHLYASTGYKRVSETFDEVEKCYLREMKLVPTSIGYLSVKLNYTLREHFHVGLMRMFEAGVHNRVYNKMHTSKPSCVKGASFRPLGLIDIKFAVDLMCWGLATALLILLLESLWRKYKISRIPLFQYIE